MRSAKPGNHLKWKSKWISTNSTSTIEVLREEVELSNTYAYCLRYALSHHTESHLGKKQPQAKIAIAFLFSQLHFNNVTSHALFYGGHLVMRSKRCAVQNQGITLRWVKDSAKSSKTLHSQNVLASAIVCLWEILKNSLQEILQEIVVSLGNREFYKYAFLLDNIFVVNNKFSRRSK